MPIKGRPASSKPYNISKQYVDYEAKVTIRVGEQMRMKLGEKAKKDNISVSALIRNILENYISQSA